MIEQISYFHLNIYVMFTLCFCSNVCLRSIIQSKYYPIRLSNRVINYYLRVTFMSRNKCCNSHEITKAIDKLYNPLFIFLFLLDRVDHRVSQKQTEITDRVVHTRQIEKKSPPLSR